MGTSRRRTPPGAPVSPGPKGARTAYRDRQKTSKSPFGFKEGKRVFRGVCAENYSTQPCNMFHQVDQRTALQQLDRFNPRACLGPVAKGKDLSNVLRALRYRKAGRDNRLPTEHAVHSDNCHYGCASTLAVIVQWAKAAKTDRLSAASGLSGEGQRPKAAGEEAGFGSMEDPYELALAMLGLALAVMLVASALYLISTPSPDPTFPAPVPSSVL